MDCIGVSQTYTVGDVTHN